MKGQGSLKIIRSCPQGASLKFHYFWHSGKEKKKSYFSQDSDVGVAEKVAARVGSVENI